MTRPRRRWLLVPLMLAGVASEAYYYLEQESLLFSEERLAVEALDDSIEPLAERFNNGTDRWRMLVLVSPMAPISVAGLDRLLQELLLPDPDLAVEVSVVYFGSLPWDQRSKARTRPRFSVERRWRFYWDPQGRVSDALATPDAAARSGLEGRYLIYPPGVSWESVSSKSVSSKSGEPLVPALAMRNRPTLESGEGDPFTLELEALREKIATGAF